MNTFDDEFFNEIARIGLYEHATTPKRDDYQLHVSELRHTCIISNAFVNLTHKLVDKLAERSGGRYMFERDFRVNAYEVSTHSQGRAGRKHLHIGFHAVPPNRVMYGSGDWKACIGLGFDFRNEHGILPKCVNDYEVFSDRILDDPELFNVAFGSFGGYAEPLYHFNGAITAEKLRDFIPTILDEWLFFGRRLTLNDIASYSSLDGFVEQCIQTFDMICKAGFFHHHNENRALWL